jgi:hypothetical protein
MIWDRSNTKTLRIEMSKYCSKEKVSFCLNNWSVQNWVKRHSLLNSWGSESLHLSFRIYLPSKSEGTFPPFSSTTTTDKEKQSFSTFHIFYSAAFKKKNISRCFESECFIVFFYRCIEWWMQNCLKNNLRENRGLM